MSFKIIINYVLNKFSINEVNFRYTEVIEVVKFVEEGVNLK
jgi:hypothetical protein